MDVGGVGVLPEVLAFLLVARLLTARHLGGLLRRRIASGSLLGAGHFSRAAEEANEAGRIAGKCKWLNGEKGLLMRNEMSGRGLRGNIKGARNKVSSLISRFFCRFVQFSALLLQLLHVFTQQRCLDTVSHRLVT